MLIRALSLAAIIFGIMIWLGTFPNLLSAHMGFGFLIAIMLAILAVIALVKRIFALGVLGLCAAVLLPAIGMRQFPLAFRHLGPLQVSHVIIVFAALGIAESTYQGIRKADQNTKSAGTPAA
jgi:hypothetical protein